MVRPKETTPTAGELEILKVLWETGPATGRQVMEHLKDRRRAYTSVTSLLNVMTEKGLLRRTARGRAFVYKPLVAREKTLAHMVGDLLGRAFEGSARALVTRLLDASQPDEAELDAIRRVIRQYRDQQEQR